MLFLFVFGIITCVFILKQLFASGSVIIGEYAPIITSPSSLLYNQSPHQVAETFHFRINIKVSRAVSFHLSPLMTSLLFLLQVCLQGYVVVSRIIQKRIKA